MSATSIARSYFARCFSIYRRCEEARAVRRTIDSSGYRHSGTRFSLISRVLPNPGNFTFARFARLVVRRDFPIHNPICSTFFSFRLLSAFPLPRGIRRPAEMFHRRDATVAMAERRRRHACWSHCSNDVVASISNHLMAGRLFEANGDRSNPARRPRFRFEFSLSLSLSPNTRTPT